MSDTSDIFVQTLRERIASAELKEPETGIEVEEHDYEDLDKATRLQLEHLQEKMRAHKAPISDHDYFRAIRKNRRITI